MEKSVWMKQVIASSMAVVLLVGLLCALSTRGTGYRTDQVAVLRVIADKMERQGLRCARFDVGPDSRAIGQKEIWERTLFILGAGKLRECGGESGGVTIRRDPFGLPYVASLGP